MSHRTDASWKTPAWQWLRRQVSEMETMDGVIGLLEWDQQTMMPSAGGPLRSQHLALMSRLRHQVLADPLLGRHLQQLESEDPDRLQRAALRNLSRSHARARRVPAHLVERLASASSRGFNAWIRARERNDFGELAPALSLLVELTVETCRHIDDSRHVYDVLLDDYDPGTDTASLRSMFSRLGDGLREIMGAVRQVDPLPALDRHFQPEEQRDMQLRVVRALGFDLEAGRLDAAEHPFTVGLGPGDVRITSRVHPDNLLGGLGAAIHEAGHAMYEQGLPANLRGTTLCQPASMGLHESQSRFWENYIGRSLPFFRWMEPMLGEHFPGTDATAMDLYRGANRVVPGLIRVQADEVTYNLHVSIRFQLELALLEGRISVDELPDAWNEAYHRTLGIRPDSLVHGVLQDVHWASGLFGYFPSYTLGNLYAALLGEAISAQVPDLWGQVERGHFSPVLAWLRENIHSQGHIMDSPQLLRQVAGDRDPVDALLAHLWERHGRLHGVERPLHDSATS